MSEAQSSRQRFPKAQFHLFGAHLYINDVELPLADSRIELDQRSSEERLLMLSIPSRYAQTFSDAWQTAVQLAPQPAPGWPLSQINDSLDSLTRPHVQVLYGERHARNMGYGAAKYVNVNYGQKDSASMRHDFDLAGIDYASVVYSEVPCSNVTYAEASISPRDDRQTGSPLGIGVTLTGLAQQGRRRVLHVDGVVSAALHPLRAAELEHTQVTFGVASQLPDSELLWVFDHGP